MRNQLKKLLILGAASAIFLPAMVWAKPAPVTMLIARATADYTTQFINLNTSAPIDALVFDFNPAKLDRGNYAVKIDGTLGFNNQGPLYLAWSDYEQELQTLGVNAPVMRPYTIGFPKYNTTALFIEVPPVWTINYQNNMNFSEPVILAWYKALPDAEKDYIRFDQVHKELKFYAQPPNGVQA